MTQGTRERAGRVENDYQGILVLDKPGDHTSHDVIARVRGILHMRRVGHGGTLDPIATGVLPVFLGRATRCADLLPVGAKRYTASVRLGFSTDTQDITGQVTARSQAHVSRAGLEAALRSFGDGYEQIPPMYSAVQVGGQRLYDLARQGVEVERAPRRVDFSRLELCDFDEAEQTFTLDVECSKGTYVRTLCHDLGLRAGSLATLCALRRTMSAGFTLEGSVTLEALTRLADEGRVERALLPVERAFTSLPRVMLAPSQTRLLKNGVKIDLTRVHVSRPAAPGEMVSVYDAREGFVAVGTAGGESGLLENVKLFCQR